jgi:hypothetical protein
MIPGFPETYGQGKRQFIGHALVQGVLPAE